MSYSVKKPNVFCASCGERETFKIRDDCKKMLCTMCGWGVYLKQLPNCDSHSNGCRGSAHFEISAEPQYILFCLQCSKHSCLVEEYTYVGPIDRYVWDAGVRPSGKTTPQECACGGTSPHYSGHPTRCRL